MTLNSPISSIKDLYAWYETSLDSSFDEAEASDGSALTNWYDLKVQKDLVLDYIKHKLSKY